MNPLTPDPDRTTMLALTFIRDLIILIAACTTLIASFYYLDALIP